MSERNDNNKGNETKWAELMTGKAMKLQDALKFLNEDFPIRSLEEVLCEAVGFSKFGKWTEVTPEEARSVLIDKMGAGFEQKINSWLLSNDDMNKKKRVESIKLDSAMQIAFALGFTLETAEEFLKRCWLDALYLRDVKDIIYRCGLMCGFNYTEVEELIKEFSYLDKPNPDPEVGNNHEDDDLTQILGRNLEEENITCPDDLRVFIKRNEKLFGSYKRRVYTKLIELHDQIKSSIEDEYYAADDVERDAEEWLLEESFDGDGEDNNDRKIGVKATITQEDLLRMLSTGLIDLKDRVKDKGLGVGLSAIIRRHVIDNIPGRSEWSGIINQRADKDTGAIRGVDRKLLILIWLSSYDGSLDGDPFADMDGGSTGFAGRPGITPEQALENHLIALNDTILLEYGFPPLDPRHPFDWVIMNTLHLAHILHKGEDGTDIPIRMEGLFRQL